jgi:hypothetical protein
VNVRSYNSTPPDTFPAGKRKMHFIFIVFVVQKVKIALRCHVGT